MNVPVPGSILSGLSVNGDPGLRFIHETEQEVNIGYGQGAPTSIAGWSGLRSSALGSHFKPIVAPLAYRSATRRDGLDTYSGREHPDRADFLFVAITRLSSYSCDISGGSAHVKGKHLIEPCRSGQGQCSRDTSSRATQKAVDGAKFAHLLQLTGTRH